ncbi:SPOR domain-containing protein [Altererythrobacter aestuarii]|uniref:SPOR domain-containing protein n=2 Tax=Alteraurantiacibacter aestuarii TaxID=650004 RepID=A0A844ZM63_9SPHN|nr:SPOR domain-containing protein [Alteraurantiacibacter aestuarii]
MWPGDDQDEGEATDSGANDQGNDDVLQAEEQLVLADDGERLPWLESDEEYEEEGFNTRLILFALLGLLAVAAIVFTAWFFLRDQSDNEMSADGSTISAPDEPYKERPEDPGGSEVAGTGDVSYGVGEGQVTEGRLADTAPAPSIDIDQAGNNASADDASDSEPAAATTTGVGVQVGAFSSRAAAQNGWAQLRTRFSVLQGVDYRIVEGAADSGTIYRLQAVASNAAAADTLCRAIRSSGGDCQVKR